MTENLQKLLKTKAARPRSNTRCSPLALAIVIALTNPGTRLLAEFSEVSGVSK